MRQLVGNKTRPWNIVLLEAIGNVQRAVLAHPEKLWRIDWNFNTAYRCRAIMSPGNHNVFFPESQIHIVNSTNAGGAFDDSVQNRLNVRRRPADDPQHLSRCRLMFQGLAQFRIALLNFLEQPDVLDGDDSLSGKGLKQFDLLLGERSYLRSANEDGSDRSPLPKQWCS